MAVNSRMIFTFLLMTLVSACSDRKTSPPSAQRATPPPTVQRRRVIEPSQRSSPRTKPSARQKTNTSVKESWPAGIPRENQFRAWPAPQRNFAIGPASGGPNPNDWFVAVRPEADSDSTAFSAIIPEWGRQLGARSPGARLPAGFTPLDQLGYASDGWPQRIHCEADGATMAYVPGSVFLQGVDDADPNAAPTHPADVDSFYIDVMEVTLGQYQRFLDADDRPPGRPPPKPVNLDSPESHPALGVPWRDAQSYAEWAKKALPTESEWELAARGPRSFVHPWGNGRAVWGRSREPGQIDPVGSFGADRSVYGVLDLAGNAREWVADFYHETAYERNLARDGSVIRNWTGPKRPSPANHKVIKGGGSAWELWHRGSASMRASEPNVGFRCVLRLGTDQQTTSPTPGDGSAPTRRLIPRIPAP